MSITATKAKPDDGIDTSYKVAVVVDEESQGEEKRLITREVMFHTEQISASRKATATFTSQDGTEFTRTFDYDQHCKVST